MRHTLPLGQGLLLAAAVIAVSWAINHLLRQRYDGAWKDTYDALLTSAIVGLSISTLCPLLLNWSIIEGLMSGGLWFVLAAAVIMMPNRKRKG